MERGLHEGKNQRAAKNKQTPLGKRIAKADSKDVSSSASCLSPYSQEVPVKSNINSERSGDCSSPYMTTVNSEMLESFPVNPIRKPLSTNSPRTLQFSSRPHPANINLACSGEQIIFNYLADEYGREEAEYWAGQFHWHVK